jgi:hypothetical protein
MDASGRRLLGTMSEDHSTRKVQVDRDLGDIDERIARQDHDTSTTTSSSRSRIGSKPHSGSTNIPELHSFSVRCGDRGLSVMSIAVDTGAVS